MMKAENISIQLTRSQALVLFDWLSRSGDSETSPESAEQRVLWLIEGQLEKVLIEQDVQIVSHADWWLIGSSMDWLNAPSLSATQILFERIHPMPEAGVNSMRSEVLIKAFASRIISTLAGERMVLAGQIQADDFVWSKLEAMPCLRTLGFEYLTGALPS